MTGEFQLVTVYQVVNEDNDGNPTPTWMFFDKAGDALTYSKPGTWSGNGREPIKHDALRYWDGRVRLLSKESIHVHLTFNESQERLTALDKLTDREKRLLGLK